MVVLAIITAINTIAIIYLLFIKGKYYYTLEKKCTWHMKYHYGYVFTIWKRHQYYNSGVWWWKFNFKNKERLERLDTHGLNMKKFKASQEKLALAKKEYEFAKNL